MKNEQIIKDIVQYENHHKTFVANKILYAYF